MAILEENMLKGTTDLRLGWNLTFQQENNSRRTMLKHRRPSQSLDLNLPENMWPIKKKLMGATSS